MKKENESLRGSKKVIRSHAKAKILKKIINNNNNAINSN